jgi:hypothetical protein
VQCIRTKEATPPAPWQAFPFCKQASVGLKPVGKLSHCEYWNVKLISQRLGVAVATDQCFGSRVRAMVSIRLVSASLRGLEIHASAVG